MLARLMKILHFSWYIIPTKTYRAKPYINGMRTWLSLRNKL